MLVQRTRCAHPLPLNRLVNMIVLYMLLVVVWDGASMVVDGATIPTLITTGYYETVDDTTATSGTMLMVSSMSNAAGPEGPVFNATRLTIAGRVRVECPSTASGWSKPLTVIIRDGMSSTVVPSHYIEVSGVLAYNSSITIEGGSYIVPQRFVNCPSGLAIQDGSTILIEGGTYDMQIDSTRGTSLFVVGNGLTIMNGSSVTISSNTLVSSNIDAPAFWHIRILHTYGSSPTAISDRSTISIIDNAMSVNDINTANQWYWYIIDFSTTNNGVTISNSSSVRVDGNTMVASNVSVALSNGYVYGLAAADNVQLTITHSSTMSFSNNNVSITNMSMYGHTYYSMISMSASNHIFVSESSQLLVSYNNFRGEDITSRTWRVITMHLGGGQDLNVSDSSTVAVSDNEANLVRVVSRILLGFSDSVFFKAGTILGAMYVVRNSVVYSEDSSASVTLTTVNIENSATLDLNILGVLTIENNTIQGTAFSKYTVLKIKSDMPLYPAGLIVLSNNNVGGGNAGNTVVFSDAAVSVTPMVSVCNNTVNDGLCTRSRGEVYSCAADTLTFDKLVDCIPTPTRTTTLSPTMSVMPPPSATPTNETLTVDPPLPSLSISRSAVGQSHSAPSSTSSADNNRTVSLIPHPSPSTSAHYHSDTIPLPFSSTSRTRLSTPTPERGGSSTPSLSSTSKPSSHQPPTITLLPTIINPTTTAPPKVVQRLPESVTRIGDTAMGGAVVIVAPSGIIRAGIVRSLTAMLTCTEFDPSDAVGFISNPIGWAAGAEELQYHRGSVITSILILCFVALLIVVVSLVVKRCSTTAPDWGTVIDTMRLPSMPLVVVLLVSEMSTPSATSMLLYDGSTAVDIVLALVFLGPMWFYIGVFVYMTAVSSRHIIISPVYANMGVLEGRKNKKHGCVGAALLYALEPTDDILLMKSNGDNDDVDVTKGGVANRWLRRNFYFVADRRWSLFGSLEVVGGTLINMLEGIPLTTTSRTLCIARPACVMVITAILLVLLLWKVPCAVRMQQWCSVFVLSGMLLTSILATANAVTPSENVELASGYVGVVAVGASMILGILEAGMVVLTYVPVLREILSLRPRGLDAQIERSSKEGGNGGALHVPMLVVAGGAPATAAAVPALSTTPPAATPPPTTPPVPPTQHHAPLSSPRPQDKPRKVRTKEEEATVMRNILEELEEFERQEEHRKHKKSR